MGNKVVDQRIADLRKLGKKVTHSSSSTSKGAPVVAVATDRRGNRGRLIGKQFPKLMKQTQITSALVSAINRNPFLEPEDKRRLIRQLTPGNMRRMMNDTYATYFLDADRKLAENWLDKASPKRLAKLKHDGLI